MIWGSIDLKDLIHGGQDWTCRTLIKGVSFLLDVWMDGWLKTSSLSCGASCIIEHSRGVNNGYWFTGKVLVLDLRFIILHGWTVFNSKVVLNYLLDYTYLISIVATNL